MADLTFYYSGATAANAEQKSPRSSLGGYVSSSRIPNASLSNLFLNIGLLSDSKFETKCIVLKNTSTSTIRNLELWFTTSTNLFTVKIGASWMGDTTSIEQLKNTYSLPYDIEFYAATITDKVGLGNPSSGLILPGEMIALWIKREVDRAEIANMLSCENLYEKHVAEESLYDKEASIEINLTYDKF